MIEQIIWGIVIIASGIVAVVYARKLVEWFGTSATFEKYLGSGGTYTGLRIVGIFLAIIGVLLMTGFLDDAVIKLLRGIGFSS